MERLINITAQVDYIHANPKGAYYTIDVPESNLEDFKAMTEAEQYLYIQEAGTLEIMDLNVEDMGDLSDIEIHE